MLKVNILPRVRTIFGALICVVIVSFSTAARADISGDDVTATYLAQIPVTTILAQFTNQVVPTAPLSPFPESYDTLTVYPTYMKFTVTSGGGGYFGPASTFNGFNVMDTSMPATEQFTSFTYGGYYDGIYGGIYPPPSTPGGGDNYYDPTLIILANNWLSVNFDGPEGQASYFGADAQYPYTWTFDFTTGPALAPLPPPAVIMVTSLIPLAWALRRKG